MKTFWANGVASSAITKKKNFNAIPSTGKVMITVFWDTDGVILVDVMAIGETIRAHTSKPSKNQNSVTGECGLTEIQDPY